MRAVTFQAPGQVRVEEKADPEVTAADEALVQVEASGICGSDLHIYHGRVPVEPGFTVQRQEKADRQVHYTIHAYATDAPSGRRYGATGTATGNGGPGA